MRHGIVLFASDRGITPAQAAKAAEERGFGAFYVPEHSHMPIRRIAAHPRTGDATLPDDRYLRTLDPWVSLATAAAVTSRIRLCTAVALPVQSDPVTLAKTIATLDHLSGGRVTVGAGFGWNTDELADHGVPAARRRTVLREYVEAMRALWTLDEAEYDGEFVTFGPCWAYPKPVQQHIPLIIGAGGGPKTFAWIVRHADGWLTSPGEQDIAGKACALRQAWAAAGRPGEPDIRVLIAARPSAADLDTWARAGAGEFLWGLPDAPADVVEGHLDRLAARLGILVVTGSVLPELLAASALDRDAEAFDVVIIGFGIGGGCAALEAARAGARVLMLERAAVPGGTTCMAGGHFYLGGGTPVQRATGHEDSAADMYKYLVATSKDPEHDKIRAYCDGSAEHFGWLESLGFEFERSFFPGKAVIQPGTEGLMFTGNEKVWPFCELARPAPRGHKVPVAGDTGGAKLVIDLLRDRIGEAGVAVRYQTGATALVIDESGTVAGLTWRSFGSSGAVRARSTVIAAGGFVMNPEMVAAYTPALGARLIALGTTYDDGLGIRLGMSAGAGVRHMDEPFITAPFYPPPVLTTGLIVNSAGQRFVAEDSYHARTSRFVLDQDGAVAYLIVDSAHVARPEMPLVPLLDGYESVAEMEAGLGMPAGSLARTLVRYNHYAARGEDPDFRKSAEWLAPQDQGPWAVFDLRLGHALYAGFTLGGLRVTVDAQVQRPDGSVIPGLYAAGACASNIAQDGKGYCSGTQLGEGSFFGRRAGRHAAHYARALQP